MGGFKGQQSNGAQDLSCHLIVKDKGRWSLASPRVVGRSPGARVRPGECRRPRDTGEARSPVTMGGAIWETLGQDNPLPTKSQCPFWKQRAAALASPVSDFVPG